MLGNLHVRFGVGGGVQFPALHHEDFRRALHLLTKDAVPDFKVSLNLYYLEHEPDFEVEYDRQELAA